MNASDILFLTIFTSAILVVICTSYKTGFVSYSMWSATRKDQPRFRVDQTKIGTFAATVFAIFLLNMIYCFLILQGIHEDEMEGVLIFSLLNTAIIAFGLSPWLLLKERKKYSSTL